jgi:hypothetical protein
VTDRAAPRSPLTSDGPDVYLRRTWQCKRDQLAAIQDRCPHLDALASHVRGFADWLGYRRRMGVCRPVWFAPLGRGQIAQFLGVAAGCRVFGRPVDADAGAGRRE